MAATPTAQSDLLVKHALAEVVRAGQRILIVGCPPGTFPYWLTKHPSVTLWPSTEAKVDDDRRHVPDEVGAVLITRLLSRALEQNVRHQARERKLTCPAGTMSPGTVLRTLDGVVSKPTKKEEEMAKQPAPELRIVPTPLDTDTQELVAAVDDAIASLELVKEKVLHLGRQYSVVREQLVVLDTLKQFLNK